MIAAVKGQAAAQARPEQAVAGAQVYFLTQPANVAALTPQATVYASGTGGVVQQGSAGLISDFERFQQLMAMQDKIP